MSTTNRPAVALFLTISSDAAMRLASCETREVLASRTASAATLQAARACAARWPPRPSACPAPRACPRNPCEGDPVSVHRGNLGGEVAVAADVEAGELTVRGVVVAGGLTRLRAAAAAAAAASSSAAVAATAGGSSGDSWRSPRWLRSRRRPSSRPSSPELCREVWQPSWSRIPAGRGRPRVGAGAGAGD